VVFARPIGVVWGFCCEGCADGFVPAFYERVIFVEVQVSDVAEFEVAAPRAGQPYDLADVFVGFALGAQFDDVLAARARQRLAFSRLVLPTFLSLPSPALRPLLTLLQ
jgi:hypothetical protein